MKLSEQFKITKRGWRLLFDLDKTFTVCSTAGSVLKSLIPYIPIYFSARLIDALIAGKSAKALAAYALLTVGLTFLASLLRQWLLSVEKRASQRMYLAEDWLYSRKAMELAYEAVEDRNTALLRNQIKMESQTGFNLYYIIFFSDMIVSSLTKIFASVGMTLSFFSLDAVSPGMKLALTGGVLLLAGYSIFSNSKSAALESAYYAACVDVNTLGEKYLTYITDYSAGKDIRLYGMSDMIADKNAEIGLVFFLGQLRMNIKKALLALPQTVLQDFLKYGAYLILIAASIQGAVSVGSIAKYVSCLMILISAISDLVSGIQMTLVNSRYLKRFFSYFDIPNNMYQGTLTVEKRDDNEYYVEFCNVSFKYPNTEAYALRNINIKFKIGEKLAVVGANGSGKTTFIKLMCRLYDPTEGQILLNGVDIRKYDYDEYMSIFSVVFQDFNLLAMTLGQNVAAAKDYDPDKVHECLIQAGFGERLGSLPDKTETYLYKNYSKKGIEISGGEAQKIALARALYKDAPFMILDEPTAALDPVSEYEVYSKFNELAGEKTAIYISHRLASCRFCDKIAVFDNGQIVQTGAHSELLDDADGKYRELWFAQAQYYTE